LELVDTAGLRAITGGVEGVKVVRLRLADVDFDLFQPALFLLRI